MATLTLHDIDEATLHRLEVQAGAHGRTVEQEVVAVLAEATAKPKVLSPQERVAIANRIAAMTPKGVPQTDSVLILREERDR